ncbi:unnamed protein product [Ixodes persulcatus]
MICSLVRIVDFEFERIVVLAEYFRIEYRIVFPHLSLPLRNASMKTQLNL